MEIPRDIVQDTLFYLSGALPCPYLPGRTERKIFTRLTGNAAANAALNSALTQAGFRRSHDILYRPACASCNACMPTRILVEQFRSSRTQRRVARRNQDCVAALEAGAPTSEQFTLFQHYQAARHADSEMALMDEPAYRAMLTEGNATLQLLTLRRGGVLLGAMLVDRLSDGFSAIYSFFDPAQPARSLGTALILRLIGIAQAQALPHVYLGYWIAASRKMAYKVQFQPQEQHGPEGWRKSGLS